jgi:hypothetical protein
MAAVVGPRVVVALALVGAALWPTVASAQAARGVPVDSEAVVFARANGDASPDGTSALGGEVGAHFGAKSPHYLSVEFVRAWLGGDSLSYTYKARYSFEHVFSLDGFQLSCALTGALSLGYGWLVDATGERLNTRVTSTTLPLAVGVAHPVELGDGLIVAPWLQLQLASINRHLETYDRSHIVVQGDGSDSLWAAAFGVSLTVGPAFVSASVSLTQSDRVSSAPAPSGSLTVGASL